MDMSRRTAGLGLLAYGIGTSLAFMSIDAPGGDYDDGMVTAYTAGSHWVPVFALAYLGAFTTLGLLPFAARMRSELRSGGDLFWGLAVAGSTAGVIGWFLLGGLAVVFAEGGSVLNSLPHTVVYALGELSILVLAGAGCFLVGAAAIVLAAQAPLPTPLRVFTLVGGVCGLLAPFFFTLFVFWLWAIAFGVWTLASAARVSSGVDAEHQPV